MNNDHIKKHRAEMNARITGSYNDIEKSNENELEKGGEGSKGGKVIGHTTSGKPIYANHNHESHKSFDSTEHIEAAGDHRAAGNEAGFKHHMNESEKLDKQKPKKSGYDPSEDEDSPQDGSNDHMSYRDKGKNKK